MKRFLKLLAATGAAVLAIAPLPVAAAPTPAPSTSLQNQRDVFIPFDPPLGEKMRFQYEQIIERDGEVTETTSTFSIEFREDDDGFHLDVTPEDFRSRELDSLGTAADPIRTFALRPYTLILGEDGAIIGMEEEEEAYWNAMVDLLEAAIRSRATEESADVLQGFIRLYRDSPREARLAMLAESVQPAISFFATEWTVGERVASPVELASPFGPIDANLYVTLESADDGTASFASHVSLSREAVEAAIRRVIDRLQPPATGQPGEAATDEMPHFERLSRETRESYQVSLQTGLAEDYRSTETIESGVGDRISRQTTVRTLRWID